jgi:hypothetical protein
MENERFLQEQQTLLTEMLRPYQRELNRRQRVADFVNRCTRSIERDDFFQLYDLLNSRAATELESEEGYDGVSEILDRLRADIVHKIDRYQLQFVEDITRLAKEAELPLRNAFPRLHFLQGIDVEVNFAEKQTSINGKALKTVDPERIMRTVLQLKRRLYDRPFEPQAFIDNLQAACQKVNRAEGRGSSEPAPTRSVYLEYTLSQQPCSFFQDMAKGRFREYDADQFAVDFWRYFNSEVSSTSDGKVLRLNAGRGSSLWLIDQTGEKRQITSLSFH